MSEQWTPIPNFHYEISSYGRVRNNNSGRVLSPREGGKYFFVSLCRSGIQHKRYIHILVLNAFAGAKPAYYTETRHLNGNPHDNAASNLKWGTRRQNSLDKARHGTSNRKYNTQIAKQVHLARESGMTFATIKATFVFKSVNTISQMLTRHTYPEA